MLGLVSLTGALDWQALETVRRMIERRPNFYRVFAIKQRGVGGSGHRLSPHRGCTSGRGADAQVPLDGCLQQYLRSGGIRKLKSQSELLNSQVAS